MRCKAHYRLVVELAQSVQSSSLRACKEAAIQVGVNRANIALTAPIAVQQAGEEEAEPRAEPLICYAGLDMGASGCSIFRDHTFVEQNQVDTAFSPPRARDAAFLLGDTIHAYSETHLGCRQNQLPTMPIDHVSQARLLSQPDNLGCMFRQGRRSGLISSRSIS